MKKKLFRERYYSTMGLTTNDILENTKDYILEKLEEKKPTKRGKKNDKSNK